MLGGFWSIVMPSYGRKLGLDRLSMGQKICPDAVYGSKDNTHCWFGSCGPMPAHELKRWALVIRDIWPEAQVRMSLMRYIMRTPFQHVGPNPLTLTTMNWYMPKLYIHSTVIQRWIEILNRN